SMPHILNSQNQQPQIKCRWSHNADPKNKCHPLIPVRGPCNDNDGQEGKRYSDEQKITPFLKPLAQSSLSERRRHFLNGRRSLRFEHIYGNSLALSVIKHSVEQDLLFGW